jgi:hypothetical protein
VASNTYQARAVKTVQRTGAGRFRQKQIKPQRRLVDPVAELLDELISRDAS